VTDDDLARTVRETYKRIMARKRGGTTEAALRTCEVFLRMHRPSQGSAADRQRIAKMLTEEPLGSPQHIGTR
jgi:hypothetical protein